MKLYEILSLVPDLLNALNKTGIKNSDFKWIKLYKEYLNMKNEGEKTGYIVAKLSERYGICERKVYKVLRMMGSEVKV